MGPVSLALFAPGDDFYPTLDSIQYMRHCLTISELIRDYVTFHIFFAEADLPLGNMPQTEEEALKWPYDCSAMFAPYDNLSKSRLYKNKNKISLPINVGRNVARTSANTHFILSADIELYPSLDLINQFLQLVANNKKLLGGKDKPRVFAMPVFDLDSNAVVPDNKEELMGMYDMGFAVPVHAKSCSYCSLIPGQDKWLAAKDKHRLEVLTVVHRYSNMPFWEPFFIGDNSVPEYDERLSWDRKSDKPFLTHAPGPKPFDPKGNRMETVDGKVNYLLKEYDENYGINDKCEI
uniref:Uncharacterized protein n=1 Tax=Stomoxys calcitrans TaxID=35570 RepID=A0A1I8PQ64_STOCA